MTLQPQAFPNTYSTVWTAATTGLGPDFGFNATWLRLYNPGANDIFLNFSSRVATTDDFPLSSGELIEGPIPPCRGFGMVATASGALVRVLALGA